MLCFLTLVLFLLLVLERESERGKEEKILGYISFFVHPCFVSTFYQIWYT
ncbi:hypothetical protein GLYMA_10G050450v4 [Glycine max]|nr:hypothetical protein GLYMA_10G050450v4 [Glycine max]KAH1136831.1 hypothetical protein GYH30_027014 [Glycine max]